MQFDFDYSRDHFAVCRYKEIWANGESDINRYFGYCLGLFRVLSVMVRHDSFMVQMIDIGSLIIQSDQIECELIDESAANH